MYTLSTGKKLAVIAGLVEGNSIRSISHRTDVDRNTINSLLLHTGERCAALLDERMCQLSCRRLQCDEIWTYVGKKDRHVKDSDPAEFGDQWVYVALDADTKLIPAHLVGKRSSQNTQAFMFELYRRLADQRIQLTTDAFIFYTKAVEQSFGGSVVYSPTRLRHSCLHPFPQQLPFKLRNRTQDLKRESSRWQRRVDILSERNQIYTQRPTLLTDGQQLFERPGQPMQFPDDDHVELPSPEVIQHQDQGAQLLIKI
jgi:IS1 family transposase